MATTILVIQRGADRPAFIARMDAAGLAWEAVVGLPRHFIVRDVAPAECPLADDPDVEAVGDGEAEIRPAFTQTLTIDAALENASWALARIVRRAAPWNVDRIELPLSTYWRSERDGAGVSYYIIDSGVDPAHAELSGRASSIYEYYSSGGAGDDFGHGTLCASIAAGSGAGVARGATVYSAKCSNSSGIPTSTSFATAAGQVLTHYNARSAPAVCSLSFVGFDSTIIAAITDMITAGIVVTAAAGNDLRDLGTIDQYPAEADADVIRTGGFGMADIPYYQNGFGTCWGAPVDILAPAQSIRCARATVLGGGYYLKDGTSLAAPLTAGVIACMLQGHGKLTGRTQVQAVKAHLLAQATTGKLRAQTHWGIGTLPDKLLYLNPNTTAPETIAEL